MGGGPLSRFPLLKSLLGKNLDEWIPGYNDVTCKRPVSSALKNGHFRYPYLVFLGVVGSFTGKRMNISFQRLGKYIVYTDPTADPLYDWMVSQVKSGCHWEGAVAVMT